MKSKVFNIGAANLAEAEVLMNKELESVEGFSKLIITGNGQNDVAVVLCGDDSATITKPAVKLVRVCKADYAVAEKTIDAVLEELGDAVVDTVSTTIAHEMVLVIVYNAE